MAKRVVQIVDNIVDELSRLIGNDIKVELQKQALTEHQQTVRVLTKKMIVTIAASDKRIKLLERQAERREAQPQGTTPCDQNNPSSHTPLIEEVVGERDDDREGALTEALALVDDVINQVAQEVAPEKRDITLPPPHSIEKNVKVHNRGATRTRDIEWEYDTPSAIRPQKKAKAHEPKQQSLNIEGVDCTKDTWQTMDLQIQEHYHTFFGSKKDIYHQDLNDPFGPIVETIMIKNIIEEKDLDKDVVKQYIAIMEQEMEPKKRDEIGLIDLEASFYCIAHMEKLAASGADFSGNETDVATLLYEPLWEIFTRNKILIPLHHRTSSHFTLLHINHERKSIIHMNSSLPEKGKKSDDDKWSKNAETVANYIKQWMNDIRLGGRFPNRASQEGLDPERYREQVFGHDANGPKIRHKEMTDNENKTRRTIIDKDLNFEAYKFVEDVDCPQQKPGSSDCGGFMLHFMDCLITSRKPSQKGGINFRQTILKKFRTLSPSK